MIRVAQVLLAVVLLATLAYLIRGGRIVGRPVALAPSSRDADALREAMRHASVVLLVLDAARADHIGCYGYPRATTPNIDRLARESVVFRQHFCQFTRTKESTASLFTSQYPDTHLAYEKRALRDSAFTMAKGLGQAGFSSALFSSNANASPAIGLGDYFEEKYYHLHMREIMQDDETASSPEPCLRLFGRWLGAHSRERFFAYVHLMPPHLPYDQPKEITALFSADDPPGFDPAKYRPGQYDFPIPAEWAPTTPLAEPPEYSIREWINLYDANLRYGDWAVSEVERLLKDAGVLESTLLIITSDHGEAFGEHGFVWHGPPIHDEGTHIPLLMRFPGGTVRRHVDGLTETVDLLPTVFDALRLPYPEDEVQGHSLLELIVGTADEVRDYAFIHAPAHTGKYMVRGEDYALLLWGHGKWRTLYDIADNPDQTRNVLGERPDVERRLVAAFRQFARAQAVPPMHFLDPNLKKASLPPSREIHLAPDARRELQALGYLR
jgi:arylsulfatase